FHAPASPRRWCNLIADWGIRDWRLEILPARHHARHASKARRAGREPLRRGGRVFDIQNIR
ncbi:MAG: hypothetical protein ABUK17_11475, partial [Syntrophobacteria bacterium]